MPPIEPGRGLRTSVAAGALALVLVAPVRGQDPQVFVVQSELYTNVTVIDGRGGAPRPESAILVWGGEIQAIGSPEQMTIPEGTTIVDLDGAWVVPGFIDAQASPRAPEEFERMLASGITGVRERGMAPDVYEASAGEPPGGGPHPTWFVEGPALGAGSDPRGLGLASEEEGIEAIERQTGDGAGFVTLAPSIPTEWLVGLARAARRNDARVWSDRQGAGWVRSLRAGVDVASRLLSGDPALLAESERGAYEADSSGRIGRLAAWLSRLDPEGPEVDRAVGALLSRDASVIPLLAAAQAPLACVPGATGCRPADAAEADALRSAWPVAQALLRGLHEQGVRLLVGSDAPDGYDPGTGFHREMELLVEAGIPEVEVLGMATRNGAIALGRLHERGTLEIGKRADFVVLEGNPLQDIRNARRIGFVVLEGRAWRQGAEGGLERVRFR
ncbi:MAG: amidohydrolase family protein [Gemmatimonadota bacterium]|nr:amidohydrolase family protein [Gemmatimonadota bacterium]